MYPFRAPRYGKKDFYTFFNDVLTTFRVFYYHKQLSECKHCKLSKICPSLPNNYFNTNLRVKKYPGVKVTDPLFFCKDYKDNFESLRK